MASNAKKRTTMAKLQRESNLRDRRLRKAERKDARKRAAAEQPADRTVDPVDGAPESPGD